MGFWKDDGTVGCLLIGPTMEGLRPLEGALSACGVTTACVATKTDLLDAAQRGLYAIHRREGRTCVVAVGSRWPVALSLAAQLRVDRVVLLQPEEIPKNGGTEEAKQIERLRAYACRNLFFCVSEVLIVGGETSRLEPVFRRLCNARVRRLKSDENHGQTVNFLL